MDGKRRRAGDRSWRRRSDRDGDGRGAELRRPEGSRLDLGLGLGEGSGEGSGPRGRASEWRPGGGRGQRPAPLIYPLRWAGPAAGLQRLFCWPGLGSGPWAVPGPPCRPLGRSGRLFRAVLGRVHGPGLKPRHGPAIVPVPARAQ